jgi:tetratricopeptide (TPR) repeat protein
MESWEVRFLKKIDVLCKSKDWPYAKFVCVETLYRNPNCIEARKALQGIRYHTRPRKMVVIYSQLFIHTLLALFYAIRVRKKHRELLAELECLLDADPTRPWILRLLGEVAYGFGFAETAIFCIQCIDEDKRNMDDWLLIGESYLSSGDFGAAVKVANKVLLAAPDNVRGRDLLWQSSVEQSIDEDDKLVGQ